MIYPDVNVEKWCERYGLTVKTRPCLQCGILQTTSIPWASGEWRGLVSTKHACGEDYELSTAISINKNERNEWKELFTAVSTIK